MTPDQNKRLTQYLTGPEFLRDANEAIAEACADLRAHGIEPAGTKRPPPQEEKSKTSST